MAKHATESKHAAPVDLNTAVELVAKLSADLDEKQAALVALQGQFQTAGEAKEAAVVKLREAEESLLKAARAHKPEKPSE